MASLKSAAPSAAQLAYRRALEQAMRDHGQDLDAIELLAVTCHMVGQLIALQDQRRYTPDQAMQIVSANIQRGNQEVVDQLLYAAPGGHA